MEVMKKGFFVHLYCYIRAFLFTVTHIKFMKIIPRINCGHIGVDCKAVYALIIPAIKVNRYNPNGEKGIDKACDSV